jgi:hypothetical protein
MEPIARVVRKSSGLNGPSCYRDRRGRSRRLEPEVILGEAVHSSLLVPAPPGQGWLFLRIRVQPESQ